MPNSGASNDESKGIQHHLIRPENYIHSAALGELAETLIYALDALGLSQRFTLNGFVEGCVNIVLGAHLLDAQTTPPRNTILYNSEQIDGKSSWITPAYLERLKRCEVWDYSEENIRRMKARGIHHAKYVPVGYVPQLTRIPADTRQDIDILFYGSINERRSVILKELLDKGLRVECLSGVYREERDACIARAKLILNIHYYEANIFEIVRVSWLLANEKAVVAECGDSTAIESDIREAVAAVPYEQLVETCVRLVADADERTKLARKGFEIFSQRDACAILATALQLPLPERNRRFPYAFLAAIPTKNSRSLLKAAAIPPRFHAARL